ncbi:MAG: hypothetical protein HZA50_03800 [Planctomycetes bacterium]|nr:hypothetical protein [Planctomycetota bacterium]
MTDNQTNQGDGNNGAAAPQAAGDAKFLIIVGGLLLLIIICLAMLWFVERRKRGAAEQNVAELVQYQQKLQSVMTKMPAMFPQIDLPSKAVIRQDLAAEQANLNGKPAPLFRISASAGRRMGFEPGDLILIGPEPAATASAPAN